ncbi:MAG: TonB-dependent receptor [Steroidobacteraceae bacterium]
MFASHAWRFAARTAVLVFSLNSHSFGPASAATADDALPAVVVTATRTEEGLEDTLASVTLLTRTDIERLQVNSLQALLTGQAGVDIDNNGGLGKATSVFMRGTEADHVLVLVDGVRIGSTTLGNASFQDLPIEQIDRIEIVRGPRSALYGSEALGGVIQIFTRRGGGELRSEAKISTGSHDTHRAALALSGGGERAWWSADASTLETTGINSCLGLGVPPFGGCFTDEPDQDGYRNHAGALRAGYQVTPALSVEAHGLRARGRTEFDGSFVNSADFLQQVWGTRARWSPSADWHLSAQVGRATDNSTNFQGGVSQSRFDTHRDSASIQSDFAGRAGRTLSLGIDWVDDHVDSTVAYDVDSRRTLGTFAEYQARIGPNDLLLGVRRDDNAQFGGKTTGNIGWGIRLGQAWRVLATLGTGFKAPTFNELYFPFFGNPALQPETSQSIELGLRYVRPSLSGSVALYQNRIDDLIGFDASFAPVNIDQTRIRGVELTVDARWHATDIKLALSALDPVNRSIGLLNGNVLPRRARQIARLDLGRDFGLLRLGIVVNAAGARFDDLENTQRLGGYTTLDIQAEWRLGSAWRVQFRAGNVFDREYQTAAYYPQLGRDLALALRYAPAAP